MSPSRFAVVLAAVWLFHLPGLAQSRADCPPAVPDLPRLAAPASDRGLLWRLDKDGRTSWLYGTVHVNSAERAFPGPTVRQALRDVDVVALELDPSDPEIPRLMQAVTDPARQSRVLAGGLGARLDAMWESVCLPADVPLARGAPLLRVTTVALQQMRHDGFHPELAVDFMLWATARQLRKPVVALETAAQQLAVFTVADESDERDLVLRSLDDLQSGEARAVLHRLLRAWDEGDAAALADYAQWCRCVETPAERAWMKRLNDDRNPLLADRLAALHGGTTFFAGIGALHMTGPQALPRLLAARGFQVQRILFLSQRP